MAIFRVLADGTTSCPRRWAVSPVASTFKCQPVANGCSSHRRFSSWASASTLGGCAGAGPARLTPRTNAKSTLISPLRQERRNRIAAPYVTGPETAGTVPLAHGAALCSPGWDLSARLRLLRPNGLPGRQRLRQPVADRGEPSVRGQVRPLVRVLLMVVEFFRAVRIADQSP